MRFADYFGRAFSGVPASQFPWLKIFRESTLAKMADVSCYKRYLIFLNCIIVNADVFCCLTSAL